MNQLQTPDTSPATPCYPAIAISIRQPWAWLIIHAGKDIENRNWPTRFRGRVAIHASKGMTKADYEACVLFCSGIAWEEHDFGKDFKFPAFDELERGGLVGEAEIVDCVTASPSPWFCGEYGFVLRNAKPLPFVQVKGSLGFFRPGNDPSSATAGTAGVERKGDNE